MPSIRKITAEVFDATPSAELIVKHPLIGTVINNTEDTSAILDAFMAVLQAHDHPEFAELEILIDLAQDDDMLDELLDVVYTRMESLAPNGYYFGADGCGTWNYGFWVKTW